MIYQETVFPDRRVLIITLAKGESINDPSSTARRIYGPQTVKQTVWKDGGIDTVLNYVNTIPTSVLDELDYNGGE